MFPNATVRSHAAEQTAFIVAGACEYANSRPVIENMTSPAVRRTY